MRLVSLSLETLDPSVTKTMITKRGKEIPGDEGERERARDTGKEREREKQERIDQFILVRPSAHKNRYGR